MYTAIATFTAKSGKVFSKGQQITDFQYFFLPARDKIGFSKKVDPIKNYVPNTGVGKVTKNSYDSGYKPYRNADETADEKRRRQSSFDLDGASTIGMFPSLGFSDNHSPSHDTPSFGGYGGGDTGGGGASGSWDSGYSSDSGSSDSGGGGDCGGGDGGGSD